MTVFECEVSRNDRNRIAELAEGRFVNPERPRDAREMLFAAVHWEADIMRFFSRHNWQRPLAEEMWDKVLRVAVDHWQKFEGGSLRAWLKKIANYARWQFPRTLRNRRNTYQRWADQKRLDWPNEGDDPVEITDRAERIRLVRNAISNLAPELAQVITLQLTKGMPRRHIAEHLGLSVYTVNKRVKFAKEILRQLFSEVNAAEGV